MAVLVFWFCFFSFPEKNYLGVVCVTSGKVNAGLMCHCISLLSFQERKNKICVLRVNVLSWMFHNFLLKEIGYPFVLTHF